MILCRVLPPGAPDRAAVVARLDDASSVEAAIVDGNPLADDGDPAAHLATSAASRVVLWSGTLGAGLFDPHPATWLAPGRQRLDRLCADLLPAARAAGKTVCFRPHCRHVLSDAPSSLQFLRDHEGAPVEIALSPGSMIEPSMLGVVEDHLERIFETLGATPRAGRPAVGVCPPARRAIRAAGHADRSDARVDRRAARVAGFVSGLVRVR